MADPDGRVVLISGATGVLGSVAADRFAHSGDRVALVGRDKARLDEVGEQLGIDPARWLAVSGELTDTQAAQAVARTVTDRWERIDVLLHLVGGWAGGTAVVDLDPDEVTSMLDQHLWTTLHILQAVVPGMVERGFGRVLAVSSPFATDPGPRGASYALAKATKEVLIRSLAREVANSGVTANLVIVRTIDEEHARETSPSPKNAAATTPDEIVDTLLFLASAAAAAITGARIPLHARG